MDAIERLRDTMAGQTSSGITCMDADDARAILAHIDTLRAAGIKLQRYACHTDDCESVTGAYEGSCSCGYTAAWQAWARAVDAGKYKVPK